MSQNKYRKPKAARNRTIAKKRAKQLKQAQERKQRTRYSRRRQLIDAAKRRKKAVKYYQSLKHAGYMECQAAQQTAEKFQIGLSSIRRWEKLNREQGFRALMDEGRRPHTIHFQISLEVKLLVVVIRTLLGWGESRISAELERREIATISHTSVILRDCFVCFVPRNGACNRTFSASIIYPPKLVIRRGNRMGSSGTAISGGPLMSCGI